MAGAATAKTRGLAAALLAALGLTGCLLLSLLGGGLLGRLISGSLVGGGLIRGRLGRRVGCSLRRLLLLGGLGGGILGGLLLGDPGVQVVPDGVDGGFDALVPFEGDLAV